MWQSDGKATIRANGKLKVNGKHGLFNKSQGDNAVKAGYATKTGDAIGDVYELTPNGKRLGKTLSKTKKKK